MSDFQTSCQTLANLDPYKRVNYVNGLVLGVDEFVQEQLYHLEKHGLHKRALHGYGTLCGLSVTQRETPLGPELIVGPGIAVNPQGREIRLPEAHCAVLNPWLQRNHALLEARLGSPPVLGSPESLSLYLVLCHRECKTDLVPIPSGPCKTLEDSSTPSRIADAFELALRLDPPDQTEDNAVRTLVALLSQIEISNAPGGLTQDEIENLVRSLIDVGSPPPASPPMGPLHMHPDQANGLLCAALRIWVTEVRPRLLSGDRNCASGPPDEDCVLLAELRFAIDISSGGDFEVAGEVAIIEEQRPYLLHTRLLQEWLLCGGTANLQTLLEALHTFALDDLTDVETPVPGEGEVLTRRGAVWVAEAPTSVSDHGDLSGLADDDHPQYLLADGSRALSGDLSAGANRLSDLAEASTNGDAVRFEQALKIGDAAGGDLRASYPDPIVRRIQGRQVADVAPQNGQVLTWNAMIGSERWEPQAVPVVGGDFVQIPPAVGPYAIVAAGLFDFDGNPVSRSFNDLRVVDRVPNAGEYVLFFPAYRPPPDVPERIVYIVKGTVGDLRQLGSPRSTFQFIGFEPQGIRVRVLGMNNEPVREIGFMVEISAYGDIRLG